MNKQKVRPPAARIGQRWQSENCDNPQTLFIQSIEKDSTYAVWYARGPVENSSELGAMAMVRSSEDGQFYPIYNWKLISDAPDLDEGYPPVEHSGKPRTPTLNELAKKCWEQEKPYFPNNTAIEEIAHIHSELSEALHLLREGDDPAHQSEFVDCEGREKPIGVPVEMADIIIGVLRFCGKFGIDIDTALTDKLEYNKNRPDWAERAKKTK